MFDWTTVGGCEWVGLPCEVKTRVIFLLHVFNTRSSKGGFERGATCAAFCAVSSSGEGSDRLHIARSKLWTREIRVSENSEQGNM